MEPNEFFNHINESASSGGGDDERGVSLDFIPQNNYPGSDHGFMAEYEEEEDVFDPMVNILRPSFTTRVRLYLKPVGRNPVLLLLLLLLDTSLSITYFSAQIAYVVHGNYEDD